MKKKTGFTLIELLVALAIIVILASIAMNLYTTNVKKGRRTDAIQALSAISLAEERYRTSNTTYGTLAQVWGGVTTTTGGYYTLSITNVTSTGYTLTAQGTGTQTSDTQDGTSCATLTLTASGGNLTRSPAVCWPQ